MFYKELANPGCFHDLHDQQPPARVITTPAVV